VHNYFKIIQFDGNVYKIRYNICKYFFEVDFFFNIEEIEFGVFVCEVFVRLGGWFSTL